MTGLLPSAGVHSMKNGESKCSFETGKKNRKVRPEAYRHEWDIEHLVPQAYEDSAKYRSEENGFVPQ
ncbi:hypothetical protein Acr_15g0007080 [Actinidia rufa]|uniref:Uncharacterized protein n=1 Tax=Actinidia rufa TaxID=165716 RepID=A0A7J0FTR9_9ERIC|nr:hypothetical protein Acr_15g0007080 [Actinidia rufa]